MCLTQLELAAGGIKVNSQLQTSNPDVYAVGDVAAFPLQATGGGHARQEHIVNARMTAKHAVNAILGELTGHRPPTARFRLRAYLAYCVLVTMLMDFAPLEKCFC